MAARGAASEDEDITEEGTRASDKDADRGREEHIRETNELLQELRVILPGVQVLFAFLLTVAFTQRFTLLSFGPNLCSR